MNGPFIHEVSKELITSFLLKDLFPSLKQVRRLTVEIVDVKRDFKSMVLRRDLQKKLEKYRAITKELINLRVRWVDLDIFYADIPKNIQDDPREMGLLVQDWQNMSGSIDQHFREGFELLDRADKMLTNQSTASYTLISILLSVIALAVALITIGVTVAVS